MLSSFFAVSSFTVAYSSLNLAKLSDEDLDMWGSLGKGQKHEDILEQLALAPLPTGALFPEFEEEDTMFPMNAKDGKEAEEGEPEKVTKETHWVACDRCDKWRVTNGDLGTIGRVHCSDLGTKCTNPDESDLTEEEQSQVLGESSSRGFTRSAGSVQAYSGYSIPQLANPRLTPGERADFEYATGLLSTLSLRDYREHQNAILRNFYQWRHSPVPADLQSSRPSQVLVTFQDAAKALRPFARGYFLNPETLEAFEAIFVQSDNLKAFVDTSVPIDGAREAAAKYLSIIRRFGIAAAADEKEIVRAILANEPAVAIFQPEAKRMKPALRGTDDVPLQTESV